MKKQVTFVESLTKDKGVQCEDRPVTRSSEVSSYISKGCEIGIYQRVRKIDTPVSVLSGNRPFYFPKYMTTAPFLQSSIRQHPNLTAGQRRYLQSVTNIYSTEQMRRQMKQHYLNVLHSCLQSGQIPVSRRRCGELQLKQNQKFRPESSEKETGARAKSQGRRKSSTISHPNIRLPKIVNQ